MNRARAQTVVVADETALAAALAERFIAAGREALAGGGRFAVALAGGSTPKAAYALLAREHRAGLEWSRVDVYFGDERCVPPDDPQSNYKMAHDALLAPLGLDGGQVFRMHGEDEPARAAEAYAALLRARLGDPPAFDLVLLGMGPDGHTASLFPGSDPFAEDGRLAAAPFVAKLGVHRLTLTPHALNAARNVVIATAGDAKAEALAAVLEGPYDPTRYPVQAIAPPAGRLVWLVDRAAAARLTGG